MRLTLAALIALLAATGSVYAEPPKSVDGRTIDTSVLIHGEDGKPIKDRGSSDVASDPQCDKCKDWTIGRVMARALLTPQRGDEGIDPLQKLARYRLAEKILDNERVALTAAETTVVSRLVLATYPPLLSGQVIPLIDPNVVVPEVK